MTDLYTLPDLPYDYNALEPNISARVMELHHDKHHAAYVAGANQTMDKLADARSAGEFPTIGQLEKNLAFHLSGHVLHSLFWTNLNPAAQAPSGQLAQTIDRDFGSLSSLQSQLNAAVSALQGSGWAALAWEPVAQRLVVEQIHDHQSNVGVGTTPLFVIDGWEHAYYLDHQNNKAGWLEAFWQVADWTAAQSRFESTRSLVLV